MGIFTGLAPNLKLLPPMQTQPKQYFLAYCEICGREDQFLLNNLCESCRVHDCRKEEYSWRTGEPIKAICNCPKLQQPRQEITKPLPTKEPEAKHSCKNSAYVKLISSIKESIKPKPQIQRDRDRASLIQPIKD